MENKSLKEELLDFYRKHKIVTWVIGVFIVLLFIYSIINILYSITKVIFFNEEIGNFGLIGDSAGLLNSLFSGFAFLGVILTIILQSRELKQTTTELKNQKEEFQIQNQTLKRQQFENTFFKLFSFFIEIKDKLNLEHSGYKISKGEDVFKCVFDNSITTGITVTKKDADLFSKINNLGFLKCTNQYGEECIQINCNLKIALKKIGIEYYKFKKIYNLTVIPFYTYYFHLYNVINFVDSDKNSIKEDEKQKYIDYLIAILSQYEILVIFCIAYDDNNMKKLIEKYHIFKNLLDKTLPDISWKKMYYSDSAFIYE